MDTLVLKHLSILGKKVRDRVTGLEGVAVSVSFDLYGCVQCIVHPGLDEKGKPREQAWMDINRLTVTDETPIMAAPNFIAGPIAEGKQGAADKPEAGVFINDREPTVQA